MRNILKLLKTEDTYFYWVDAVFFKGEDNKRKIEEYIKSIGLDYKIVKIKRIKRVENCVTVEDLNSKRRVFNFVKRSKRII